MEKVIPPPHTSEKQLLQQLSLLTSILLVAAVFNSYIIKLDRFTTLPTHHAWISLSLSVIFFLMLFYYVSVNKFKMSQFGIHREHFWLNVGRGIVYTIPLLGILLTIEVYQKAFVPSLNDVPIFIVPHFSAAIDNYTFPILVLSIGLIQEFCIRGVLQGELTRLLVGSPKVKVIRAIILSNLGFSAVHLYLSFWLSIVVIVPGCYWGFMYYKHRSLVSVVISHALCSYVAFKYLNISQFF
jgi:hypothetical protein